MLIHFASIFYIFQLFFVFSTLFSHNKLSRKTFPFLSFLLKFIRNNKTNFRTWHTGNKYHKHSIFLWIMWITLWITHFTHFFYLFFPVDNRLSTFLGLLSLFFILHPNDRKTCRFLCKLHKFHKVNTKNWNTQLSIYFK